MDQLLKDLELVESFRDQVRREKDWPTYIRACEACAKLGREIILTANQVVREYKGQIV